MKNKHRSKKPELGVLLRYTVFAGMDDSNPIGTGWSVWHDGHMCGGMNLVNLKTGKKLPEAWYALRTDSQTLIQMNWSIH
jgi:hypothetical protein